ncbi:MAG: hypothetical protein V2I47_06270 [Bacteroidales bacterium]|jgi:hypothetical protein|nr:hypothetical protein [Bacteroidales bacterium]
MDRQQFISYIHDPAKLDANTLPGIKALTERYPYCQSLQILQLLNLQQTNSVLYDEYLASTAAYIADRKRLRELVLRLKNEDRRSKTEDQESEIEVEVEVQPETGDHDQKEHLDPVEPVEIDAAAKAPIVPVVEEDEEERLLHLKRIVESRLKQIALERKDIPEPEEPVISKEELIDKFIKEEPSISRPKPEFFNPVKGAKSSQEDKAGLVSETLARIHIQQGNIDKAIEIYRKLSLNFPEKSSYFAAQIEKLSKEN